MMCFTYEFLTWALCNLTASGGDEIVQNEKISLVLKIKRKHQSNQNFHYAQVLIYRLHILNLDYFGKILFVGCFQEECRPTKKISDKW